MDNNIDSLRDAYLMASEKAEKLREEAYSFVRSLPVASREQMAYWRRCQARIAKGNWDRRDIAAVRELAEYCRAREGGELNRIAVEATRKADEAWRVWQDALLALNPCPVSECRECGSKSHLQWSPESSRGECRWCGTKF